MTISEKAKIGGEIFLAIPTLMLLSLGIGELGAGGLGGVQHFIQLIPIILIGLFAWNNPKFMGQMTVEISLVLAFLYIFFFPDFPTEIKVINSLIFFVPPLFAGALFLHSR